MRVQLRSSVRVALVGLAAVTLATTPTTASGVSRPARSCKPEPHFVGLTIPAARRLAHRCGQRLPHVYWFPDAARKGTVVSEGPQDNDRLVASTGPLRDRWAPLHGAPGPPVAAECTSPLQLDEDGNAGPLTCHGTHVNVEAWDYFAAIQAPVMRLPRNETVCGVARDIGLDYVSGPVSYSVFELANVYNGWHVPVALAAHILIGNPYHDTCKGERHSRGP